MRKTLYAVVAFTLLLSITLISASAESVRYSNPSKAYRGTVYYNSLIAVNLTGDEREDVISVALSQLYYSEGESENDFHGINTSGNGNFTEYCYNYGALDQDGNGTREFGYPWCAAFVSFCLRRAEISAKTAPSHVNCTSWLNIFKQTSSYYKYFARGSYTPLKGDIIFFKSETTSRASDHVGLVIGTTNTHVYTVEGNTSGGVYIRSYTFGDSYIVGYAVPDYESSITSSKLSEEFTVTARTSLNLRSGPSTEHDIVTALPRGASVEVIAFDGGWANISVDGKVGWVSSTYIAPIECTQVSLTINKGMKDEYTIYAGYDCSVNVSPYIKSGMEFEGYKDGENGELTNGTNISFTKDASLIPVFKEISESDSSTTAKEQTSDTVIPNATQAPEQVTPTEDGCASVIGMQGVSMAILSLLFCFSLRKEEKTYEK